MLAMSLLLSCFEPATTAASMAIGEPEAIDDAPARAGTSVEDGDGETFLPREECRPGRQGKKVSPAALRLRRSRRSRPSARSSQERSRGPCTRQHPQEKT